jgi:hypothetical protein
MRIGLSLTYSLKQGLWIRGILNNLNSQENKLRVFSLSKRSYIHVETSHTK